MSAVTIETRPVFGPVSQPDITYTPNYDKYIARVKRRQETEILATSLPPRFPEKLGSDLVWDGKSLPETDNGNYVLTDNDITLIEAGLRHLNLHCPFREIPKEIHVGHGFKVIRRILVERYSREDSILIYLGVSSLVAPVLGRQNSLYLGKPAERYSPIFRICQRKQIFLTGSRDIIALLCLRESAKGGESFLSSPWHIYNDMVANRPDLTHTLAELWAADGSANIPLITEAQAEALDTLHFIVEEHVVALDFYRGDIPFAHNLSLFDGQGGLICNGQVALLQLWLRDLEYAWETPSVRHERWVSIYKSIDADAAALGV
ncbi:uncharacterized protein BDW43DRAFT_301857 [Aspergillus alliaceus]|uniref:uncharacterized protein n=1 Tax=Petromyces alliaceus TaxID=209559 RepID=UPI0012A758C2|nr:uncharacterized protein BDW43DRAFT_301857 [Aspergillus alliaceus]KAB8231161.1 hypothetical protein BDW43DRAFT_301857 [Aspergillus alliaceus]